ncbi:MAG: ABC transporter permease [Oscillospiraceae bacterium]|nr:ABC transporter permease [Oscillospiraceae bacterium]
MILDRQKKLLHRKSQVFFIYLFLIILMLVSGIMNHVFFTARNFTNLITTALPYILVSFAQTLVILTGGIDLSVGAVVCVSNVICATLMKNDAMSFWMGLILALLSGIAIGAINGVIITKGKIQPIIVTLAMQTIFLGVALTILPSPGGSVDIAFASFVSGKILGIPVPLLIEIVLSIALWLLLNRTRFGTSVFAVGGNEDAAYSFGIMVTGRKISVYAIAGFLSALAGVFLTAQMYSGDPTVGTNFTMNSIATAVVGGTALSGGKGGIIGSIAGVFILIIINNFLNLVNVSSFYQYVLQGAILILALTISSLRTRR